MLNITLIRRAIEKRVRQSLANRPELIPFILKHERRKIIEQNLEREVKQAEAVLSLRGKKMDINRLEALVFIAVDVFIHAAIGNKELILMSDAKKQLIAAQNGREKALQEWYEDEKKDALSTAVKKSMNDPDAKKIQENKREKRKSSGQASIIS